MRCRLEASEHRHQRTEHRKWFTVIPAVVTITASLFYLCGPASPAYANQNPGQATTSEARTATIYIAATENGRALTDLRKEDLRLRVGKTDPPIVSFDHLPPGRLVVGLILDTSASRSDELQIWGEISPLEFIHRLVREAGLVYVMHCNNVVHLDVAPTNDPMALSAAIVRVEREARGGTALYDAVVAACNVSSSARNAHRVLLVVTDGEDNASRYTMDQAADAATKSGTSVYFLRATHTGYSAGWRRVGLAYAPEMMADLARTTGGMTFDVSRAPDVTSAVDGAAAVLRSQYVLTFAPDPKWQRPVRLRIRCSRGGVKVLAPRTFEPLLAAAVH